MVSPWTTTWLMRGPVSKRWMVIVLSEICVARLLSVLAQRPPLCSRIRLGSIWPSGCLRRGAPRIAARKQTAAEKRPFQRAIAVHAAAAESGGFAGRVKSLDDLAVLA